MNETKASIAPDLPSYEERGFDYKGHRAAYIEAGAGKPVLMLHGAGPGTSVLANFRPVLEPMAARYHVHAMDLIGFGRSARKAAPPYFDFEFWVGQAAAMLDRMPFDQVAVVGHSLSGAISLRLAATHPKVRCVLTTGAVGTRYPLNRHLDTLWTFPTSLAALRTAMQSAVYDTSAMTDEILGNRLAVLNQGDYPDYFRKLFGGDRQALLDSWEVPHDLLRKIKCPLTMVHGRNDLPCPYEQTAEQIIKSVPHADLMLLARCGHSPALEHPAKVMAAATLLFG